MEIVMRTRGSVRILEVEGALDLYETPRLKDEVIQLLDDEQVRIIMNMSGVNFIDSSGMGALMTLHSDLESRDGNLVLSNLSPAIADLVKTHLGELLSIFDTEEEALVLFEEA